jgi:hypothetical protein
LAIADDILAEMMGANMHYAVREMDAKAGRHTFRPYTKGFNAAAVGANVLVNAQAHGAVEWPGADHPFLTGDCEADMIAAAIDKAEGMFGNPEWTDSLATTEAVR